jgi:hypothetical protein
MAPTTTAIDSGRTSAHAGPRNRLAQRGRPAPAIAMQEAWATVSTTSSAENHTPGWSHAPLSGLKIYWLTNI